MCEGVDKCLSTGVKIEHAPCRAIARIMESCKAGMHNNTRPGIIHGPSERYGGMGFEVFRIENGWKGK